MIGITTAFIVLNCMEEYSKRKKAREANGDLTDDEDEEDGSPQKGVVMRTHSSMGKGQTSGSYEESGSGTEGDYESGSESD